MPDLIFTFDTVSEKILSLKVKVVPQNLFLHCSELEGISAS